MATPEIDRMREQEKTIDQVTQGGSAFRNYQDTIIGHRSLLRLIYFEFSIIAGAFPGALGILFRKIFWPRLFGSCGKGVVFGTNVRLRQPHRIRIGDKCIVSGGCILDARTETENVIEIGDDCVLSNYAIVSCKNGSVSIGDRVGIGPQTILNAVNSCTIEIGNDVMIGPRCYFAGGGNYKSDRLDIPMAQQGLQEESGIKLGSDIWLGANVTVLPNVEIGTGSIVAAGSVVTRNIPARGVAMGVPAKTERIRGA